jgi:radical SAM protein with 4Fe4S-binding SPASM domain
MENLTTRLHPDYLYFACGKWLYYPERVACVKRGKFREVTPVTVQLIPSLYCNFSCPHCCYGHSKEKIKAQGERQAMLMEADAMSVVIDRLSAAGIKGVVFTGGGEPTTHPHLIDGMRYAAQKGLKVGLFTNGSLLTETKIHQLIALEPTFIRVSLDAGTPEIHRLMHGYSEQRNYLPTVLENITLLAKEKLRQNVKTTIGVGVCVEPINLNDLVNVGQRLDEITHQIPTGGIDYLVFRPTVNYQGGKYLRAAEPLLNYVKAHIPEYYTAYYDYLYQGQQLPAQLFERANQIIAGEVAPLLNETGLQVINVRTKMLGVTQTTHPFQKCRASPWYIFVGPDGTVYNCAELGLDPRVAIGNLLTQTLDEIWQGQRRQAVMDFIDQHGLQTICPPVCLYYELNSLFEKLDRSLADEKQRHEALAWIDEQEAHVQAEVASGVSSQPHREFI